MVAFLAWRDSCSAGPGPEVTRKPSRGGGAWAATGSRGTARRSGRRRAGSPSRWPPADALAGLWACPPPEASRTEFQGVDLRGLLSRPQLLQPLGDAMEENDACAASSTRRSGGSECRSRLPTRVPGRGVAEAGGHVRDAQRADTTRSIDALREGCHRRRGAPVG